MEQNKGDERGGDFVVYVLGMSFKGRIWIEGDIILVELTNKPLLVPCTVIRSAVEKRVATLC